jgi:hypothetical protein
LSATGYIGFAALLWLQAASVPERQPPPAGAPRPETLRAFQTYVSATEGRLDALLERPGSFLWADTPEKRARLRAAGVICEPRNAKGEVKVARGLIHDWVGAAFIPGAGVSQVLALVQDYDNHKNTYKPQVIDSRTLARSGNDFKVRLRLLRRMVITVVLDVDSDARYTPLEGRDWRSRSWSTRIVEIKDAGQPRERELRPNQDHGVLWRLNSYWLFREADGGAYVECEAVSLSRDAPAAIAWLIDPIVRTLPREILAETLRATRAQTLRNIGAAAPAPAGR